MKPQFNQNFSLITRPDAPCELGQLEYIIALMKATDKDETFVQGLVKRKCTIAYFTRKEASDVIQKLRRIKYDR